MVVAGNQWLKFSLRNRKFRAKRKGRQEDRASEGPGELSTLLLHGAESGFTKKIYNRAQRLHNAHLQSRGAEMSENKQGVPGGPTGNPEGRTGFHLRQEGGGPLGKEVEDDREFADRSIFRGQRGRVWLGDTDSGVMGGAKQQEGWLPGGSSDEIMDTSYGWLGLDCFFEEKS